MNKLLSRASDALSRNDADALEALCTDALGANALCADTLAANALSVPPEQRPAYHRALLAFQRQVLASRTNLVLRQRLLAASTAGAAPWAP